MAQELTSIRGIESLPDRFWSKVDVRDESECWPWLASVGTHGYGAIGVGSAVVTAHRVSFLLQHGRWPEGGGHHGGVVRHTCDNRRCCNPAHLIEGTQADNLKDMHVKGRAYTGGPKGEAARTAILTATDVQAIKTRLASGEKGVVLASEYGVTPSAISRIRVGKSWKHLGDQP